MSYFEEVFEVVDEGATDGDGDEGFAKLVLEPPGIPLPVTGGDPTAMAGDPTTVPGVAGELTFGAGTAGATVVGGAGDPTFGAGTAGATAGVAGDPTFGAGTAAATGAGT